jgi:serine/threonine-protein kinase RsbT
MQLSMAQFTAPIPDPETRNSRPEIYSVEVTAEHHIALTRQVCRVLAQEIGFSSVEICYVETSVSELAGNLFFHTNQGGTISFRVIANVKGLGLEVISEDKGPGIADMNLAMQDGFSTNGGLGCGLPGVQRLMDEFALETHPGLGTRIVARKWKKCR